MVSNERVSLRPQRFRFRVGAVVALSQEGFDAFEQDRTPGWSSKWKLGDRLTILKKFPSRSCSEEYLVLYPGGGTGRLPAHLINTRWEQVEDPCPRERKQLREVITLQEECRKAGKQERAEELQRVRAQLLAAIQEAEA
jgi:hypothetical protein